VNFANAAAEVARTPARTPIRLMAASPTNKMSNAMTRPARCARKGTTVLTESTRAAATAAVPRTPASHVRSPTRYPGKVPKALST
jgi:outer membrane biosynthesis protein TonB